MVAARSASRLTVSILLAYVLVAQLMLSALASAALAASVPSDLCLPAAGAATDAAADPGGHAPDFPDSCRHACALAAAAPPPDVRYAPPALRAQPAHHAITLEAGRAGEHRPGPRARASPLG
ncbi:hypothetical protein ABLE93_16835 [Xanthobacter sp. KR7-65]|uniref:hypothetical protein n=1 Tax=Xanthobacter sp. KR7-65 TaxID=3156612 RepID=UPI0032B3385F